MPLVSANAIGVAVELLQQGTNERITAELNRLEEEAIWRRHARASLMLRARIIGTGAYLPARVVSNDELAMTVDTSDAWIVERTGIRQRHIAAEGELTSDLAAAAARAALERAEMGPRQIDLLVVATSTPDNTFPPAPPRCSASSARCAPRPSTFRRCAAVSSMRSRSRATS